MAGYNRPVGFSERRGSLLSEELMLSNSESGMDQTGDKMPQPQPQRQLRGPPTPSMSTPAADFDQQLTGSPPPPPTPAASPGPDHCQPDWSDAADDEDFFLAKVRQHFKNCSGPQRTRVLADLLNLCTSQQLSFVHQFVSPLLKKDPFTSLPDELCLRVCPCNQLRKTDPWYGNLVLTLLCSRYSPSLTTPKCSPELRKSLNDGEIFLVMT